jgi:hypothetical protein
MLNAFAEGVELNGGWSPRNSVALESTLRCRDHCGLLSGCSKQWSPRDPFSRRMARYRATKISTMVNRQKLAMTTAVAMFSSLNSQSIVFSIVPLSLDPEPVNHSAAAGLILEARSRESSMHNGKIQEWPHDMLRIRANAEVAPCFRIAKLKIHKLIRRQ